MDGALPFVRASELAQGCPEPAWLFEGLWGEGSVGLLAGFPKVGKSWLGLSMAVSLASGRPCLGVYDVERPGPALIYMAEDSAAVVRQRLEALCRYQHLDLDALPIYVITADVLRLNAERDQGRLRRTVESIEPRMLLLDPLVRVHSIDENAASEVSSFLAYFRELQRALDTAVVLVHHCRKNGSAANLGRSLRGSGDWFAWTDSCLFLQRTQERLVLKAEHRAAPALDPVELRLVDGDDPHLEVVGPAAPSSPCEPLDERVLQCLAREARPMTRRALRERLGVRNARVGEALSRLQAQRALVRRPDGFALPGGSASGSTG